MARNSVIWRLQRGTDRYEAVVRPAESGGYELGFFENGCPLQRMLLAAGRGLNAMEEALARREALKASGWRECSEH
jgi:hypothetical protein